MNPRGGRVLMLSSVTETPRPATPRATRPTGARAIVLAGVAVEVALVLGLVWPAPLFGATAAIITPEPLATLLGISQGGLARFVAVLLVWIGGYAVVLRVARGPLMPGARRALVLFPVLFGATLLLLLPVSSKDVYHYTMEGRLLAVHGANPLTVPPAAYPDDRLAWILSSWRETPSRYGPLFGLLAGAVAWAGHGNLVMTLTLFKLVTLAALAGTSALVWDAARRLYPGREWAALALVAWNPPALYEAGANAHNDVLMMTALALALAGWARRRPDLALPALALGVLVKYVVVLAGPFILLDALRAGGQTRRRAWTGLLWAALLCVMCYVPFWAGRDTFSALTSASGDMLSSPGWLLRQALKHRLGWEGSRPGVVAAGAVLFLAGYVALLWRAWRRQRMDVPALAWAALVLELCTVSWWLWPWYALWPLPAAALLPGRRAWIVTAVATCAALAAYVPLNFRELFWGAPTTDRMPLAVVLTVFVPPTLAWAWLRWRGWGS